MSGDGAMQNLQVESVDGLCMIQMCRGKSNALNPGLVGELQQVLDDARKQEEVRGLVLASAKPGFFSAGLDAFEVFQYDRPSLREFFGRFLDLSETLHHFPKPVVAAVAGHAIAGGAILALCCDVRVMAEGKYQFALNEIKLGMVVTPAMVRMLVEAAGGAAARQLILSGDPINPQRAASLGLACELVPEDQVLDRAKAWSRSLAERPPDAFAAAKKSVNEAAGASAGTQREGLDEFVDRWFSEETKAQREAMAASLRR